MDFNRELYNAIFCDFKGLNLTNLSDYDEFELLQINDSLLGPKMSKLLLNALNDVKCVLDIGFGGGFPILPLAYHYTDVNFFGVDARNKKVEAVRAIAKKLSLHNVCVKHERIENIMIDLKCILLVKAVGDICDILKKINTDHEIKIFFYKGPNISEKESGYDHIKGWKKIEEVQYNLGEYKRSIIGYKNKIVPHGTISKKNLVKLSSF